MERFCPSLQAECGAQGDAQSKLYQAALVLTASGRIAILWGKPVGKVSAERMHARTHKGVHAYREADRQ